MGKDGNPVNVKAPNVNAEKPEGSKLKRMELQVNKR